jgi:outer membrane protein assembly factor BamB
MLRADSFQPIQTNFSTDFDFGASPTLFDTPGGRHMVATANKNGFVYALDRTDLAAGVVWTSRISGSGASPDLGESTIVSPTFANGLVFVAGGRTTDGFPGAIAALNPVNGSTVWKMHPDGFVLPAMAASGGVLAAGVSRSDGTGHLYVLNQSSGAVVFTMTTVGHIFGEPTWANGVLYVVDVAGNLYALSP